MADDPPPVAEFSEYEAFCLQLSRMCFCQPGIIESFDPATNLAEVVPAIQAKITIDEKVTYPNLPLILRVPVVVPYSQTAGVCMTVPIHKGDECLLMFSDKFMDNFVDSGGHVAPEAAGPDNLTTEIRIHHLTDAICIPGIISQPHKLPDWNQENVEMRTADRSKYVTLGPDGIKMTDGRGVVTMREGKTSVFAPDEITLNDGKATVEITGGKVSIDAPAGFYVNAPNVVIDDATGNADFTGVLKAQNVQTAAGFDANGHRHSGVQSGGGNTGTFV